MKVAIMRGLSILIWIGIGLLALPATGYAQEAVLTGTVTDSTGGVLPGVTVTRDSRSDRQPVRRRSPTNAGIYRIPARVGGYQLTAELSGLYDRGAQRRPAAGRPDRDHRPADGAVDGAGDRDRFGGSAAAERGDLEPGRQHQSRAGAGTAGAGAQLDGAGDARARQPNDIGHRDDAVAGSQHRRAARVPADDRRTAGVIRAGLRRPAALQPGIDRGVPVHLEPVRRHDGPIVRRAGARHHALGHQHASPARSAATSATAGSTRRTRC